MSKQNGEDAGSAPSQPTVAVQQQHARSKSDQSTSSRSTLAKNQCDAISVTVDGPTDNMQEEVEAEN